MTATSLEFVLVNPYQLAGKLIAYEGNSAVVTDLELNVLDRVPLNLSMPLENIASGISLLEYSGRYAHLFSMIACAGKLYALVYDYLWEIDLFDVKQLAKIPGRYNRGFCRVCLLAGRIMATNETEFFLFNAEACQFEKFELKFNGELLQTNDTGLFSFGANAIVLISGNNMKQMLWIHADGNYELLYAAQTLEYTYNVQGLVMFVCGPQNNRIVVDLTKEQPEVEFSDCNSPILTRKDMQLGTHGLKLPAAHLAELLPDADEFEERRDATLKVLAETPSMLALRRETYQKVEFMTPNRCSLMNPFQLEDQIIFYDSENAYITDLLFVIQKTCKIRFIGHQWELLRDNNALYEKIQLFQGKLYTFLFNTLFEVDMFTVREVARIDGLTPGFGRMCVVSDQLFVHNEHHLFRFSCDCFVPYDIQANEKSLQAQQIVMYSFGQNAVMRVEFQGTAKVVDLVRQRVIYAGNHLTPRPPASGVAVFNIGREDNWRLVVDLTQLELKVRVVFSKKGIAYKFGGDHVEFTANEAVELDAQFEERRDAQIAAFNLKHGACLLKRTSEHLAALTPYGRPAYPEFRNRNWLDVFDVNQARFDVLKSISAQKWNPIDADLQEAHFELFMDNIGERINIPQELEIRMPRWPRPRFDELHDLPFRFQ